MHQYTSTVTTEATCENEGVRTYTCDCGDSYTEAIPATGHSYTYTSNGDNLTHTGTCSVCGNTVTENHTISNGTCTADGCAAAFSLRVDTVKQTTKDNKPAVYVTLVASAESDQNLTVTATTSTTGFTVDGPYAATSVLYLAYLMPDDASAASTTVEFTATLSCNGTTLATLTSTADFTGTSANSLNAFLRASAPPGRLLRTAQDANRLLLKRYGIKEVATYDHT